MIFFFFWKKKDWDNLRTKNFCKKKIWKVFSEMEWFFYFTVILFMTWNEKLNSKTINSKIYDISFIGYYFRYITFSF